MQWLAVSVVLSVLLTVVLNVALRSFPQLGSWVRRKFDELAAPKLDETERGDHRARVFVPLKAMFVASVVLTILLNVLRWIA